MGLRLRRGHYYGVAEHTLAGHWVVSVSKYMGAHGDQHHWATEPPGKFFRLDVLNRQLLAAGIRLVARLDNDNCLLTPIDPQGRVSTDGRRIKKFMSDNYGTYGDPRRSVHWSWTIRQYG